MNKPLHASELECKKAIELGQEAQLARVSLSKYSGVSHNQDSLSGVLVFASAVMDQETDLIQL